MAPQCLHSKCHHILPDEGTKDPRTGIFLISHSTDWGLEHGRDAPKIWVLPVIISSVMGSPPVAGTPFSSPHDPLLYFPGAPEKKGQFSVYCVASGLVMGPSSSYPHVRIQRLAAHNTLM